MSITVSTRKGDGSIESKTVLSRDEDKTEQMLRTELAFIDAKLERAGTNPNQLTVRRAELVEALAALSK